MPPRGNNTERMQPCGAKDIELLLAYQAGQLRVLASDDGCGMDECILQSGREGHAANAQEALPQFRLHRPDSTLMGSAPARQKRN